MLKCVFSIAVPVLRLVSAFSVLQYVSVRQSFCSSVEYRRVNGRFALRARSIVAGSRSAEARQFEESPPSDWDVATLAPLAPGGAVSALDD